jgi:trigger factor
MQFSVESIGSVKKRISVEIPAETVDSEIEAAYGKLKSEVRMDGFRKGKVPRSILERYYKGKVEYDVASKLINESFNKAVSEEGLFPISEPEVEADLISPGNVFKYTATVEIRPEITVKGYEGLRIEREKVSVTDAMVDKRIEALRRQNLTLNDVERPLRDGDTAIIDFEGFMDGVPFKGGKGEGVPLKIGSGRFIPGFEEQLVGMSAGDEKEISVKFPEDYHHKDYAGKDATFGVRLKGVKEEVLPAVDDELAKDIGLGSLNDIRDYVRKGIEREEEAKVKAKMREQVIDALIEANPFEVPQSMVKKQKDYLISDLKNRYGRSGVDIEKEIEKGGSLAGDLEERALGQVKTALILAEVAKKEGLRVTEGELDERLISMAVEARMDAATLRSYYEKGKLLDALRREILDDKVFDLILSKANVIEK